MSVAPALAGRVGVVTGASSGIGAAVARTLAADGMAVVIGARRADRLGAGAGSLRGAGGLGAAGRPDMQDEAQVERLIETAAARGRLDALVNNAAIGYVRTVADGRSEEWRGGCATSRGGAL